MHRALQNFRRDETGGMTILILGLFIGILLITGIPMDLMKQEGERADLQAAVDRCVLASASLTQTLPPQEVCEDYVAKSVRPGLGEGETTLPLVQASLTGTASDRRIDATASYATDAIFLGMVGYKTLDVAASAAAAQGLSGAISTEISLVLDISGTMRYDNRLPNLKVAAKDFIDQITAFGVNNRATINLIPYAGQVNPGPFVFSQMGGVRQHDMSSCPELTATDFERTGFPNLEEIGIASLEGAGLPGTTTYAQVPHFHHWEIDPGWMDWGWCPSDDTAITYLSSDADLLRGKIDTIRLHDGTGTYNGMKWGLALLDPAMQPLVDKLVVEGDVDAVHAGRPYAWGDNATAKYIVLMTDGQITEQLRPTDPANPALATQEVLKFGHPWKQTLKRADGLARFYHLCTEAKRLGVTVFTIAFEAPEAAKPEMQTCASSQDHYFEVTGLEISDAFREIATTIQKLKLVR